MSSITRALFALGIFVLALVTFLIGIRIGSDGRSEATTPAADSAAPSAATYTCSMHPQVRSAKPGDCPICGMELIVVSDGDAKPTSEASMAMTASAIRLADIVTQPVVRRFPVKTIRLVGEVDFDETRMATIAAHFPGRLERVFVDSTGVPVREGDHLAEVYSPELVSAQEELRQAQQALESRVETTATMRVLTEATYEAAREKLRLWGLTEEQIETISRSETAVRRMTIFSPISGVVIERHAVQGQYVAVGERIYTVADLGVLWILLDAYESQLQWVHYGQRVEFTTDALPGRTFVGRISFIEPVMSRKTRTVQVRVNVDNSDGLLKPGMFVRTQLRAQVAEDGALVDDELSGKWISPMHPEVVKNQPGSCDVCGMALVPAEQMGFASGSQLRRAPLVIPASAPLITGTRAVVYVRDPSSAEPRFEGREVVLGPRAGDNFVVRSGLSEGEQVVVKGAFKIDSAMQIAARPSMMSAPGSDLGGYREALDGSLTHYLAAQRGLAGDDLTAFVAAAVAGLEPLMRIPRGELPLLAGLRDAADHLDHVDIVRARALFRDWSELLIAAAARDGLTLEIDGAKGLVVAWCPMAFDNAGAEWIQRGERIDNPYFGAAMLRCGEVRRSLAGERR